MSDDRLAILSDAKKAVAMAHDVVHVQKLIKLAEVILAVTDTEEMREKAMELYLRSRKRRGEIVEKLPKQEPGQYQQRGKNDPVAPTLKEQGIDKHEVKKDYKLLTIPEPKWEAFCAKTDKNFTAALRIAKGIEREKRRKENAELAAKAALLPDAKAQTIVIDPPWNKLDEGDVDQMGRGQPTYEMVKYEDLLKLKINERAEKSAHLYLWITNRSLPKGFPLLEAWGFRYIVCLTWCKPSFGIGNYFRGQTEHILFGVRGSLPLLRQDVGTCFNWNRAKDHSSKPEEFYDLIETCSPGPWMDLYARRKRPGWICWGAEIEASI